MLSVEEMVKGYVTAALWADLQWPHDPTHSELVDHALLQGATREQVADMTSKQLCERFGMPDPPESGGGESQYSVRDLTSASLVKVTDICQQFIDANHDDLESYVVACETGERIGYHPGEGTPLEWAGHDLWLTAGGHGAGFWDRGLGDLGDRLTAAAGVRAGTDKKMTPWAAMEGSALPYVTDNNEISFIG